MYKKNTIFSTYKNVIKILIQCPQVMKIHSHIHIISKCVLTLYIQQKWTTKWICLAIHITHPARSSTKRITLVLCLVIHHTSSKVKHQKDQTLVLCVFDSQVCAQNLISRSKNSKPKGMTCQKVELIHLQNNIPETQVKGQFGALPGKQNHVISNYRPNV